MGKVKITFVGDIFPANLHYTIGFGIASQFFKHRGKQWVNALKPFFACSDISFGNLEAPLIEDEQYAATHGFAGSFAFAGFLKDVGINIVSIANNHILEQNVEGFYSTIESLKRNNIHHVGQYVNGISNIEILSCNGIKMGFAGFNAIHDIPNPDLYANYHKGFVINTLQEMSRLNIDLKIISLHWGNEYINIPSIEQVEAAHEFVDNGADVIVGHHPHVVQPVERYKGKLILYSLGNFLFDMIWSKNVRRGLAVTVTFEKDRKIEYELRSLYIEKDYTPSILDHDSKFDCFMKKNTNIVNSLHKAYYEKYDKVYQRRKKINHLYQRILMKLFLLRNWHRISGEAKKMLLKNNKFYGLLG